MAVPKKIIIDTNPPQVGNDYLKYGFDRIEKLMNDTNLKTKYLPRTILFEDLDQAVFDYVNNDNLKLVIDDNTVPTFYLDNDRWGELSKTWKFSDGDKNVATPYITVRRIAKSKGTRMGTKSLVPQLRKFRYYEVPILDNDQIIYLIFKTPEPINTDLKYEISLFTKYRVDVNLFDEKVLKAFASLQSYVFVKGNPMPLKFEDLGENNTVETIDGDRLFVTKFTVLLQGFIQNEKDFEITKTKRKSVFGYILK
jgi:hypothetical protein